MDFTYRAYIDMIGLLRENDYQISDYHNWKRLPRESRCAILRHDIDFDIRKALSLADVERNIGVNSTYFVLITSPMYNALSKESCEILKKIREMGHFIGLHYDETRYMQSLGSREEIVNNIQKEIRILEEVLGFAVDTVSMHRPSRQVLDADLSIPGVINSYGAVYFSEFKYLSDSRKKWREPILDIISEGKFKRMHILTHAYWYDNEECSLHDSLVKLIKSANKAKYMDLRDNITDIDSIINSEEVE